MDTATEFVGIQRTQHLMSPIVEINSASPWSR